MLLPLCFTQFVGLIVIEDRVLQGSATPFFNSVARFFIFNLFVFFLLYATPLYQIVQQDGVLAMMMMRSLAVGGNNLNNVRLRIIWLFALSVLPRCIIEG